MPSVVVETGVVQGVSSYMFLKALQINGKGKLVSVELPNRNPQGYTSSNGKLDSAYTPAELEPGWLVPMELRDFWELKLGRSSEVLPTIRDTPDLFYHDSEHSYENMTFEYEWAYQNIRDGGIVGSDDVHANRAFPDFARKHADMRPLLIEPSLLPCLIKRNLYSTDWR